MAIVSEFNYFKPKTVKEAVTLLTKHRDSSVLAGGTDLVYNVKVGAVAPVAVVDIKGIPALGGLAFKGEKLKIGALVTFSDLLESETIQEHFPLFAEMARTVGSAAIRNRATMVGNICAAVPCMDSGPILSVYEAVIMTAGPGCNPRFCASDWFKGPRQTPIGKLEIVTSITVPLPAKTHAGCFIKLGRYKGEDLAQASVAVLALPKNRYRAAFGSVGPVPVRAHKIEDLLNGNPLEKKLVKAAQELIPAEIAPIDDVRASKEYRLHMCKIMFERAVKAAAARLEGAGPPYGTALI